MAAVAMMRHGVMLVTIAVLQIKASGVVLDLLRVESEIAHRYAVTHVRAAFVNQKNTSQEIPLRMTLPTYAYVSSLVIEIGGKNHSTVVTEKQRHRRKGPILQQSETGRNRKGKEKTHTFRASAKARGFQAVTFYLIYEELLLRRRGSYTHTLYLGIAKRLEAVEVSVRVLETEDIEDLRMLQVPWSSLGEPEGEISGVEQEISGPGDATLTFRGENITIIHTNTNNTEEEGMKAKAEDDDGIFSIAFDVDRQTDGGEIQILGQFFVHRFSPEGLPKLPTHTVFVLDVSGSMHDNGKLKQLKTAMGSILTDLPPEDSFEVLVFSTRVTSLGVFQAVPSDIERSLSRIQRLRALGGTNFNDALLKALQDINSFNLTSGAKQVVFLTDGQPNLGEKKPTQLRRNIREANIHNLPIFSLGFGQDADMRLLRQVSSDNRGFTRKIDEEERPADQLKGFYDEISSPLMTDVDVLYLEDEVNPNSVVRQGPSTFYAGDEMILAGQLRDGVTEVQPIVTGQGNEGPLQFRVSRVSTQEPSPERDNYVERLWAYLTVKDLLDMQEVVEDRNLRAEMNFRALEIALKFHFVTKLTSLKPEEQEEEEEEETDGIMEDEQGLKSASRHQKSNTGSLALFYDHATLLSEAEFAKTLPAPLSTRLNTASGNRISFGDNDPHFVVQVSGMEMPLCFDIHGRHGQVLSLVRDHNSGIVVNGLVTSALDRPEATYFTELFIGLGMVNFTITPHNITITALEGHRNSKVGRVLRSVWPFKKMYRRGGGRNGKSYRHSTRQAARKRRALSADRSKIHIPNHFRSYKIPDNRSNGVLRHDLTSNLNHSYLSNQKYKMTRVNPKYKNLSHNHGHRECWNHSHKRAGRRSHIGRRWTADIERRSSVASIGKRHFRPYIRSSSVVNYRRSTRFPDKGPDSLPPDTETRNPIRKQRMVSSFSDDRTSLNLPQIKSKFKKSQRKKGKVRKRGKSRYKRNTALRSIGDLIDTQAKNVRTHKRTFADIDSKHTHKHAHPHSSEGHRLHKDNLHPQVNARRHAKIDTHKRHSNPLAAIREHSQTRMNKHQRQSTDLSNVGHHEPLTTTGYAIGERLTESLESQPTRNRSQVNVGRHLSSTSLLRSRLHSTIGLPLGSTKQIGNLVETEGHSSSSSSRRFIHPHANRDLSLLQTNGHLVQEFYTAITSSPTIAPEARSHAKSFRKPLYLQTQQHTQSIGNEYTNRGYREPEHTINPTIDDSLSQFRDLNRSTQNTTVYDPRPQRKRDDRIDAKGEARLLDTTDSTREPHVPKSSVRFSPDRLHPQSKVFDQTTTERNSDGQSNVKAENESASSYPATILKRKHSHPHSKPSRQHKDRQTFTRARGHRERADERRSQRKSERTFTWRRAAGRRYGDVVVALRNRKKLDFLIGDVKAHFVITRSKTKYGQEFLGFYVEEHKILSPNTTGIIGQFAYKTVGTLTHSSISGNEKADEGMKLAVLHPEANMQYRVSEVNGIVSKRRSMLHKSHVRCLLIPHQGRGLVTGVPEDYILPCLAC